MATTAANEAKPCCAKTDGAVTAKAEGVTGCPKSAGKAAMTAKTEKAGENEPSLTQLASWAESGCDKSKAALIAKAKGMGCEKTAALAAKAESGCSKSSAELMAVMKKHDSDAQVVSAE